MGRGKFQSKHTGHHQFSTPEEILGTFKQQEAEESRGEESGEESDGNSKKCKGVQGIIEIENPNLVQQKALKARDADVSKTPELSRREREELEKQKAHERRKTEQARKDLERLSLIRQQRAEAATKREEEKAAKEQKKAEARK